MLVFNILFSLLVANSCIIKSLYCYLKTIKIFLKNSFSNPYIELLRKRLGDKTIKTFIKESFYCIAYKQKNQLQNKNRKSDYLVVKAKIVKTQDAKVSIFFKHYKFDSSN